MSRTEVETILNQALRMSEEDRAEIAERLISTLDNPPDPDIELAWQQEVQRRIQSVESGEAKYISWEEVLRCLRNKPC